MYFTPRILRKDDQVQLVETWDEETRLLFDGWLDGQATVPAVDPHRHIEASELVLAPTAPTSPTPGMVWINTSF